MKSFGIIIEKDGHITAQNIEKANPRVIKGKIGSRVINIMYVKIPMNELKIKAFILFPLLSINSPIMGIRHDDMRKGNAIIIPT